MEFTTQEDLFKWIWDTRPHFSEITGERLGNFMNAYFFIHILSKKAYPNFALYPQNIVLGTAEEHKAYDEGYQFKESDWVLQYMNPRKDSLKALYYAIQKDPVARLKYNYSL